MHAALRIAPVIGLLLMLGACQLQLGFEDALTETYNCGLHWVVAYSPSETIRAQLYVETGAESLQEEWEMEEAQGDFAEGSATTFDVYVGSCMNIPGCGDVSSTSCGQVLHHHCQAVSGWAEVAREGETIEATIIDAVLEGTEGEEPITLDLWEIPAAPLGPS